jgi:hypothetical protein
MHSFAYYFYQVAAFATAESSTTIEQDNDDIEEATSTSTDWITVALVSIVVGWMCYQLQFYEPETGHFQHHAPPLARATLGIARRLASDTVRFALNILAIIAELLLAARNTFTAALRKTGRGVKLVIAALKPFATEIWRCYDTVKHSHYANLVRQRLRSARASFATILPWTIVVSAAFKVFVLPSIGNSTSLEGYDIRPYVVPLWVIKARPENRHYEGSSCHYRPDSVDLRSIQGEDTLAHFPAEDLGMIEDSVELQEQPVTITRTLVFAEARASETGSAVG